MPHPFTNHPLFGSFRAAHTPSPAMLDFYRALRTLAQTVRQQGIRDGSCSTLTDYETGESLESPDAGLSRQIRFYALDQEKKPHDTIWFISPVDHEKIQIRTVFRNENPIANKKEEPYTSTYTGLLQIILDHQQNLTRSPHPDKQIPLFGHHLS